MTALYDRLILEKTELGEKIKRLAIFLNSDDSDDIDDVQKILLRKQFRIMKKYYKILLIRIEFLKQDKD